VTAPKHDRFATSLIPSDFHGSFRDLLGRLLPRVHLGAVFVRSQHVVGTKANCKDKQFSWFHAPQMPGKNWTLSPSDFAFLWEECKRCFYLKIVSGFRRPGGPMPKILNNCLSDTRRYLTLNWPRKILCLEDFCS
jgi:hypothetical protein